MGILLRQLLVLALSTIALCQDLFLVSNPDDGQAMRSNFPLPGGTCQLSQRCVQGLNSPRACHATRRNGGRDCYKGLKIWQQDLTSTYGCPLLTDPNQPVLSSRAFCWCGLGENHSEQVLDVRVKNHSELAQYAAERQGSSPASTSFNHADEQAQGSSLRRAGGASALLSRQMRKVSDEENVANVEGARWERMQGSMLPLSSGYSYTKALWTNWHVNYHEAMR